MNGFAKVNGNYNAVGNGFHKNGALDPYCNGNIIVLNYTEDKPTEFGDSDKVSKVKRSSVYFQSKFGRCCSAVVLVAFILVLLCLVFALLFFLYFFALPSGETETVNSSGNETATSTHLITSEHQPNQVDSAQNKKIQIEKKAPPIVATSDGDFIIKVSLHDPQQVKSFKSSQAVDHSRLPLIKLTQLCQEAKGECWYHRNKYPNSCRKSYCQSVEYRVSWNYSENSMQFQHVDESYELDAVPDRTPCGQKSWCLGGRCVESDDPRLAHYDNSPPTNGGWENNCENPKCLVNGFSRKSDWTLLLMATKCPGMPCSAYTTEIRRLQFRSCTNPLPSHDGSACNAKDLPVLWGPICQDCPSMLAGQEARKLWPNDVLTAMCGSDGRFLNNDRCSCVRSSGQVERVDEGAPCRSKFNESRTEPGHCFYGICLNYVGFKRQCDNY